MHVGMGTRRRFFNLCGGLVLALWATAAGAQNPQVPAGGACAASPNVLCLRDNRFEVSLSWRTAEGLTGQGVGVALSNDTGYFWFFDAGNVELIVKVLDACGPYGRHWVFASGLTNVEVVLLVTDTVSGDFHLYINPLGRVYVPIQDTETFSSCP